MSGWLLSAVPALAFLGLSKLIFSTTPAAPAAVPVNKPTDASEWSDVPPGYNPVDDRPPFAVADEGQAVTLAVANEDQTVPVAVKATDEQPCGSPLGSRGAGGEAAGAGARAGGGVRAPQQQRLRRGA
ncbi:hypothetical protein ACLQ20_03220 [Micromonospora sp. DT46]|uniref:hypothetical protein n=1 Tax=Micromonospora sp. DT46 TaxID=3393435 RepID=UPI003CEFAB4F